jgi:putative membrane protein insertion efficiency factor
MFNVIQKILLLAIGAYRRALSPLMPANCRFAPTCSEYASEAIERYGALRGVILAAKRLLKCHPLHPGGCDPVR